jgi:hypothetical protein
VSFLAYVLYLLQTPIIRMFNGQCKLFFRNLAAALAFLTFPLFLWAGSRMSRIYLVSLTLAALAGLICWCHECWLNSETRHGIVPSQSKELGPPDAKTALDSKAHHQFAREFLGAKERVFPTRLGNIIFAFESHSFEVYKIDASTCWYRLTAVLPDEYRKQMADAEARFLAVLNLAALSYFASAEFLAVSILRVDPRWLIPVVAGCAVGWVAYRYACELAKALGEYFRSAFDLYRLDLLRQLGVNAQNVMALDEERKLWTRVQSLTLFSDPKDQLMLEFRLNWENPPRPGQRP